MARRFDEVDLLTVPAVEPPADPFPLTRIEPTERGTEAPAPRWRRVLGLAIDLSLFLALGLVLSPLIPVRATLADSLDRDVLVLVGHAGFLLLLAYFYFTGSWLIWGKTIGGSIFDVRVIANDGKALSAAAVSRRFVATLFSLGTAGLGFLPGLLPGGRTSADRVSSTRCVRA